LQVNEIVRILALETAVQPGSIALLENAEIVAQMDLAAGTRTTRTLIPAIHRKLDELGWPVGGLDLVAVSQGPGSFTGLRVGITVAKTLAYAVGADVLGVETLDVIARQVVPPSPNLATRSLWTVMDAQRQQLFCAKYECGDDEAWRLVDPLRVVDIAWWLESISDGDIVSGPPIEKLRDRMRPGVTQADPTQRAPRATTVGEIAWHAHQLGRRDDVWGLVPKYHRLSAAEEKRADNQKTSAQ